MGSPAHDDEASRVVPGVPRDFGLPDAVAGWDDQAFFTFLQDHQLGYQALLDDLKARGLQESADFRHYRVQFQKVEALLARDFNRRYQQG